MRHSDFFDKNNYSINENSKYGIYIIHGFSSTTYEIKELINFLAEKEYYIKADNLPGHATNTKDCNLTSYQEWFTHVETGLADMASRCNNIFVIGSSMGAVLALHLATLFPLKGIVCGSTHILFKKSFKINYLLPLFYRFISDIPKSTQSDLHTHKKNSQYYGYLEYPIVALNEMRRLINIVKKELQTIKCPTLMIHSLNDQIALKNNVDFIHSQIHSKIKEIFYVKKSHHNIFDSHKNPDQKIIFNKIEQFIKQHL